MLDYIKKRAQKLYMVKIGDDYFIIVDTDLDPISQEQKLFYVGVTRTKENLVMYKSNQVTEVVKQMASNYKG